MFHVQRYSAYAKLLKWPNPTCLTPDYNQSKRSASHDKTDLNVERGVPSPSDPSNESSHRVGSQCRLHWETERSPPRDNDMRHKSTERERIKSVTSYYNQYVIDVAAAKQSVRLTPASLLYTGKSQDDSHLLRSAQYLHRELPVRLAHRITNFRHLPFIIGCNPIVLSVHDLYIRSFKLVSEFPALTSLEDEQRFTQMLRTLLDDHKDVVTMLAEGFREVKKHIGDSQLVRTFLDRTLTSRLGLRMLAEHHIALHEAKPNHIGIIKLNFSPKKMVELVSQSVMRQCEIRYGMTPNVKVQGHVHATFPYISPPVEYILTELLKNSLGATVEQHIERPMALPDVVVTVASNDQEFFIRISDMGGGIPVQHISRVWDYNFSTEDANPVQKNKTSNSRSQSEDIFEEFTRDAHHSPMRGFGFGLPTSRAYAVFMGGDLRLECMQGFGTDTFLRLRHITSNSDSFRI